MSLGIDTGWRYSLSMRSASRPYRVYSTASAGSARTRQFSSAAIFCKDFVLLSLLALLALNLLPVAPAQ